MDLNKAPSFSKLAKMAQTPVDLTSEFSAQRISSYVAEGCGLTLFYGAERVSPQIIEALCQLSHEAAAPAKMAALQSGEVMNVIEGYPSENRPALHTAMRDFFGQKNQASPAKKASELAWKEIEKLKKFLSKLDPFTDLVQIGIGGSSLGPEAVCLALEAYHRHGKRVHFLSNVDPDETAKIFSKLDLKKTVVIVVSKSGSTLETLTNETLARSKFEAAGLNPGNHFIAVTGEGSPMDNPKHYLASFYMWDYIGGRYSSTSMVGGVALSFLVGIENFLAFLKGASEMDKHALTEDPRKNLPLLSALLGIWNRNFLGYPTVAIIPYSQALSRLPAHLQQLDMESNGKRIDKQGKAAAYETGPVIWGEPGTNGQHSFFQLIHQGTSTVPLEMIGFVQNQYGFDLVVEGTTSQEKLLSNLFAQSIALAQGQKSDNPNKVFPGNRPSRILIGKKLTPEMMGTLLAYYEHKVAFQGFIFNINSFDQEGVQLGKGLALKMIEQFKKKDQRQALSYPIAEAFFKRLPPST